ncbi:MAG: hypothetical protein V4509_01395, partial [Patescibacteria group bacterium]
SESKEEINFIKTAPRLKARCCFVLNKNAASEDVAKKLNRIYTSSLSEGGSRSKSASSGPSGSSSASARAAISLSFSSVNI